MKAEFENTGRVWIRGGIAPADLLGLGQSLQDDTRPGARITAQDALYAQIAAQPVMQQIAACWPGMTPVRMVSFAKDEGRNWSVPWHQDRIIAVQAHADVPGFGNWSQKGGQWHCEPPPEVLQNMLFVRLHLDASTADNGAMEIALGSHHLGVVPAREAEEKAQSCDTELTLAEPGDVLILSMLTLHRSRPATDPAPRRVLRVDMAAQTLPQPLAWAG